MKQEGLSASIAIALSLDGFALPAAKTDAAEYESHEPIVVENVETSPDAPYVIEGYEIANPDGSGIQVRHVDHVIIRNNYLHDCGTKISEKIQDKVEATGDARCAMMSHPDETGAINVFDAKTVEISGNRVINNDYGDASVLLTSDGGRFVDRFRFGTNTIDGKEATGNAEVPAEQTFGAVEMLAVAVVIILVLAGFVYFLLRRKVPVPWRSC